MESRCGALRPPSSMSPISARRLIFFFFSFPNKVKNNFFDLFHKSFVYICVDGKSVYYNRLANIDILRIGDLIYEDNKPLTNHLRELNISPLDAFRLACVIDALPTEWRAFLKTCNHSVIEPFNLQNQVQLHLRTFARNFSNIDFFLKLLPLKDDELAMSEM